MENARQRMLGGRWASRSLSVLGLSWKASCLTGRKEDRVDGLLMDRKRGILDVKSTEA